jgi:hypothetical protein
LNRRLIVLGGTAAVVLVFVAITLLVFSTRRRDSGVRPEDLGAMERTLLIPHSTYILPDVEEDLLNPGFLRAVHPDQALSAEQLRDLQQDVLDSLENTMLPSLEEEVRDLLF